MEPDSESSSRHCQSQNRHWNWVPGQDSIRTRIRIEEVGTRNLCCTVHYMQEGVWAIKFAMRHFNQEIRGRNLSIYMNPSWSQLKSCVRVPVADWLSCQNVFTNGEQTRTNNGGTGGGSPPHCQSICISLGTERLSSGISSQKRRSFKKCWVPRFILSGTSLLCEV